MTNLELAKACIRAAENAKATDIALYDLRGTSSITDYAIVCTATSVPHLRAVLLHVDKEVGEEHDVVPVYSERTPNALWSVLDYIDVMLHVMTTEVRDFYGLEAIWKPENRVSIED